MSKTVDEKLDFKKKKTAYKAPLLISISVFSLSMLILWASHARYMNTRIAIVGGIYALICFSFLVFQIVAFVRSHIVYDEDIEMVKLRVFEVEKDEEYI